MRGDLAFLPALWAEPGDVVMADDVEKTLRLAQPFRHLLTDVEYVGLNDRKAMAAMAEGGVTLSPWGWNLNVRHQLLKAGIPVALLPTTGQVDKVRQLSHRAATIPLMQKLKSSVPGVVGEREEVTSVADLARLAGRYGRVVVKAPWSSSGRGVRFVDQWPQSNLEGFVRNLIARQGSVVVEPFYDKATDFAMEFVADGQGHALYRGLSLFQTVNGAYTGNLLAEEEEKRHLLSAMVDLPMLDSVAMVLADEVGRWCDGCYSGPFGVDMMVVRTTSGYLLHPCVEVNMRRTMGHVALDLARRTAGSYRVMRIVVDNGNYKLQIDS